MRLMPTSITTAPGLIQSPRIISGRPTAATRMSARAAEAPAGRRVRECAIVTVQSAAAATARSACRRGSSGRPPPRAGPRGSPDGRARSSTMLPAGVQGTKAASSVAHRRAGPTLIGWSPSDVLVGIDRADHRAGVEPVRQRQLHQDAVDRRDRRSAPATWSSSVGLRACRPAGRSAPSEAAVLGGAALVGHIDLARRVLADQHHGQARRLPGRGLRAPPRPS